MVARSILQKQEIQQQQQKMSNVKQNQACLQQLHQSSILVGSPYGGPSSVSAAADSVKESSSTQKTASSYPINTASSYPINTASFGYYYPGYGSFLGSLDTQRYYTMEFQYPVMQADNGSFFYAIPGLHPSYDTYSLCSHMTTTIGVEGQYVSEQMHPSSPMLQSAIVSNGYNSPSIPYEQLVSSPYLSDPSLLVGYGYNFSNPSHPNDPPKSKSSFDVISGQNNKLRPLNKASSPNLKSDMMAKGSYAVAKYPVNNLVNVKEHGKSKNRSKISSFGDLNSLINEKKHGSGLTNATDAMKFQCNAISSLDTDNNKTCLVRRDQYNLPEFEIKHDDAYFFVIKSYSEDDIHKSIKYNVWASTPNGNKRLDSAYRNAQEKIAQKGIKCPVYLLFSVNASGQFCGVAEMIGQVDFGKNMNFWQQDKWNGSLPVKWHIIKDIPNSQLRHIILENNESKPVTNSRDTQEVKFKEGIEILNIFKNYVASTSIIDDFGFYESRQKALQEKRIKQSRVPCYDLQQQQKLEELTTTFLSLNVSTVKDRDGIQSRDKERE